MRVTLADKNAGPMTSHERRQLRAQLADLIGPALLLITLLIAFVTLEPFEDRSSAALLSAKEGGNPVNQIVIPLLLLASLFFVALKKPGILAALWKPALTVLLAWLALTVATSTDPGLSARRVAFAIFVIGIYALTLALPRTQRELATLLAAACLIALALSYAGVIFAPHLSIHLATDAIESSLAGDWRGLYSHKNEAGSAMVIMVIVGLYVARAHTLSLGIAITASAAIFLIFTKSKTSIGLVVPVLLLSLFIVNTQSLRAKAFVVIGLLVLANTLTVGSAAPGPLQSIVRQVLPDASYTGRTDLWRFAIDNIGQKPLFGHGYGAFWRTDSRMNRDRIALGSEDSDHWVEELGTDSHNGYLEVALSIGLPGLIVVLIWLVILPLYHQSRLLRMHESRALELMFVRMWLFGLFVSVLESAILARANQPWIAMVIAVFGLQLMTRFRMKP